MSIGLHRVLAPAGVLPQAAWQLDPSMALGPDETRIKVRRLNLDAASFRQLREANDDDGDRIRAAVLAIVTERGKMHNPVTGSGGMLVGTVEAVGPESPLGFSIGDRVATLVSLSLTPLVIHDDLREWDGKGEQVPCDATAILFGRSIAARLPDDLPESVALAVLDVCGAPALTARVVAAASRPGQPYRVAVLGGGGKSGSLSLAAARAAGATVTLGVVPTELDAGALSAAGIASLVAIADATNPVVLAEVVQRELGAPADLTVVCVDVPGCEHGAILATCDGGTVIFFSMATSFTAAALGAEGLAADVTMLVGNGYVPGHADYALELFRATPGVQRLFFARLAAESGD